MEVTGDFDFDGEAEVDRLDAVIAGSQERLLRRVNGVDRGRDHFLRVALNVNYVRRFGNLETDVLYRIDHERDETSEAFVRTKFGRFGFTASVRFRSADSGCFLFVPIHPSALARVHEDAMDDLNVDLDEDAVTSAAVLTVTVRRRLLTICD